MKNKNHKAKGLKTKWSRDKSGIIMGYSSALEGYWREKSEVNDKIGGLAVLLSLLVTTIISVVIVIYTESNFLIVLWFILGFLITWTIGILSIDHVLKKTQTYKTKIKSIDDESAAFKAQNLVARHLRGDD